MKRYACMMAVAMAALIFTTNVQAAEPAGNVDQNALAAMGLSGLEVMSDTEGEKVRGTFALAWGTGSSQFVGGTPILGGGAAFQQGYLSYTDRQGHTGAAGYGGSISLGGLYASPGVGFIGGTFSFGGSNAWTY